MAKKIRTKKEHITTIPCRGSWNHSIDGDEFDCDYEHAGVVDCDQCIVNGGKLDSRTGKRYARRTKA